MSPAKSFQSTPSTRLDPNQPRKQDFPYWMVWARWKGPAKFRHRTAESACLEADRLAAMNPGRRYYVLCVIGSRMFAREETLVERQIQAV